jgi:CheY-like chemotaxis protein
MTQKRILIVDDEIGSSRLLKANLDLTNLYEVRIENRPENAVRVARQFKPHLVLLDIVMPHLSGINLAEMLLADPELNGTTIVFLTAAHASLLPQSTNPLIDRLPRIAKPACMEDILHSLEQNLSPLGLPRPSPQARPAQPFGGNNESA